MSKNAFHCLGSDVNPSHHLGPYKCTEILDTVIWDTDNRVMVKTSWPLEYLRIIPTVHSFKQPEWKNTS